MKKLFLTIVCVSLVTHLSAQAGYVLTLDQVGPNVVATGSGAIDLTDLSFSARVQGFFSPEIWPNMTTIITGPTSGASNVDEYIFINAPANFGSGGGKLANSGSGDLVGASHNVLLVPALYNSNTPLSDSSVYDNATFSSLGVTPGIYEWTWGNGVNQNFTLEIGEVPEASTILTPALAVIFLLAQVSRRWVVKANSAGR